MRHWLRRYREVSRGRREAAELETAAPAPTLAASTSRELRETPIELDPNHQEKAAHEVSIVSSQRQWAAARPDEEVSLQTV